MASLIEIQNPNDYKTNSLWQSYTEQSKAAKQAADGYVDTIKELKEALLALPENRIQRTIDANAAKRGVENAKIQLETISSNPISPEIYD